MNRIQISATGTSTGCYTLVLNPMEVELNASTNQRYIPVLDGGTALQQEYFDNRPVMLTWNRIPYDFSGFQGMLATLQSFVGSVKYIHFRDAEYRVFGTGWTKFRFGTLDVKANPGGRIKCNVTLTLHKEPL